MPGLQKPRPVRGLLFDKDGTILDFYPTWIPINRDMALEAAAGDLQLARLLLRNGGHDPDTDIVQPASALSGASLQGVVDCFAATLGSACPDGLFEIVTRHFREGGAKYATLVDGADACIQTLADDGYLLGIATNDTTAGLNASLSRCGDLQRHFGFQAACDSGFGAKPEPGMALAFSKAVSLEARDCAMIGDTLHDFEMARRASYGLRIGVLTGASLRSDLEPHCDIVIDSIRELPDTLRAFV